jgi:uncharacterized protein (DUF1810 family)
MWFVFPQIAGLGFSAMAQRFAIGSKKKQPLILPTVSWGHGSSIAPGSC